jgi:hypothetical protein
MSRRRPNNSLNSTVPLHVDILASTSNFIELEMRARGCCKGRMVDELVDELQELRKLSTHFRQIRDSGPRLQ